jgi:hypothetical protein
LPGTAIGATPGSVHDDEAREKDPKVLDPKVRAGFCPTIRRAACPPSGSSPHFCESLLFMVSPIDNSRQSTDLRQSNQ